MYISDDSDDATLYLSAKNFFNYECGEPILNLDYEIIDYEIKDAIVEKMDIIFDPEDENLITFDGFLGKIYKHAFLAGIEHGINKK
jgi:hypothetical protein